MVLTLASKPILALIRIAQCVASARVTRTFLSTFHLQTKVNTIIWRSNEDCFEFVADVLDADKLLVVTRKETEVEFPNYHLKSLKENSSVAITSFANPYASMVGVTKEKNDLVLGDYFIVGILGTLGLSVSLLFAQLSLAGPELSAATVGVIVTLPMAILLAAIALRSRAKYLQR